jgi:large subunit ribosomal protein L17
MRHRISGRKLSRPTAHRMSLLHGMVTDLIRHESIRTTEAKAREVRRMAEKIITEGKKGDLAARRRAAAVLSSKGALTKLFDELGPRYESRPGGYTRMFKLGPRKGDAAPLAIIELMP